MRSEENIDHIVQVKRAIIHLLLRANYLLYINSPFVKESKNVQAQVNLINIKKYLTSIINL